MIVTLELNWMGHVARMGEMINAYKILVGKPERKRPLVRYSPLREDNIRMEKNGGLL
jgi:hypothetical protein